MTFPELSTVLKLNDMSQAFPKYKYFIFLAQAFRPGVVDLPAGASEAPTSAINVQNFGEFEMDIYPIASRETFSLDSLPLMDKWMPALTQTQAK